MADDLPTVEALKAEHDRLEAELKRLGELADLLENDDGFDELDRLSQVMKADLDHHFPAEEKLARQLYGADDEGVVELRLRHKALTTHYRTLLAMIQDIRDDVLVDRERFMTTVRAVRVQLRAHLDAESRLLLSRSDQG